MASNNGRDSSSSSSVSQAKSNLSVRQQILMHSRAGDSRDLIIGRGASWPGNGALCSFTTPQCPAGQQCTSWGGCPKYGDYNGNACAAGRAYMAWASATAPPGLPAVTGINIFSSVFTLPDIEITNLAVSGTKWCATITATEAGQPVAGAVVINRVTGSTNQQICFPQCSTTVSDVECDPQRKPPCRIFHVREPIPCQGTVSIPGVPPVQISVGPP
jgi:hypothetical protein